MSLYLGIDPGGSGGIAGVYVDGPEGFEPNWAFSFRNQTETDIWNVFHLLPRFTEPIHAVIEAVHSFPQQGVASTFSFGQSYGFLRGMLVAHRIVFKEVSPSVWQRIMGLTRRDKKETLTAKKNRHKAMAQQLFPELKVIHYTADALLLAQYCRENFPIP